MEKSISRDSSGEVVLLKREQALWIRKTWESCCRQNGGKELPGNEGQELEDVLGQVVRGGAATMWRLKARLFQQVLDVQLIFNKKGNS